MTFPSHSLSQLSAFKLDTSLSLGIKLFICKISSLSLCVIHSFNPPPLPYLHILLNMANKSPNWDSYAWAAAVAQTLSSSGTVSVGRQYSKPHYSIATSATQSTAETTPGCLLLPKLLPAAAAAAQAAARCCLLLPKLLPAAAAAASSLKLHSVKGKYCPVLTSVLYFGWTWHYVSCPRVEKKPGKMEWSWRS